MWGITEVSKDVTVERTGHHTGAGLRRCLDFIVRRAGRNHDRVHFAEQREDSDVPSRLPCFLDLGPGGQGLRIVRSGKTKPV